MAKCDLCGEDAGFLRKRHRECQSKLESGSNQIVQLVCDASLHPTDYEALKKQLSGIAASSFIREGDLSDLVVAGWEKAVENALEDDILSEEEEKALIEFCDPLLLSQDDLDIRGAYTKVVKAGVIRDLLEDELPERVTIRGDLPFNLQKSEEIVWLYPVVQYYEQRTTTKYRGSYQGVSLRVAKGVYYRTGGFKGNPTPVSTIVHVDDGMLAITNKHLYFAGQAKSFRIAYPKIVSFNPYSDGIGVQRDAQTAKPQIFMTNDGWFTYNLITNLARIAAH